ncbi:phytanoyl-CoA dioxygenase family protein [Amycolatopsis sp. NPDC051102]|uniref:phytanoyl-CoA dioxygenase family protein n=1 Tax=Amycolatopsis sp. NPDC051102 TaxID=3155163 RepID=UPI00341E1EDD
MVALTLTDEQRRRMDEDGYIVIPDALSQEECDQFSRLLDTLWFSEGLFRTHDFDENVQFVPNLLQYSSSFERCVSDARVLDAVQVALGARFRLNRLQSRRVDPGGGHQPLHDLERSRGGPYFKANVIWCLDEFTPDNGSTRVIAGSHRSGEPFLSRCTDPDLPHPDEQRVLASRGSAIVHNSHLLHGGTKNESSAPRRSIHTAYATLSTEPHWSFDDLPPEIRGQLSSQTLALLYPDDESRRERFPVALGSCGVNVTDLGESIRFYEAALGFEVVRAETDGEYPYALMGRAGTVLLTLWQQAGSRFDRSVAGLHHLSFEVPSVDDLTSVEAALRETGVVVRDESVPGAAAETGQVFFEDPDGIRLEVYTEDVRARRRDSGRGLPRCALLSEPTDEES